MRRTLHGAVALGAVALGAGAVRAGPVTGPAAQPLPLPGYATPAPAVTPAPPPAAVPRSAGPVREFTLSDVRVRLYGGPGAGGHLARVARNGRPPAGDPGQGPRLDLRPGEAMDPAWVRRQFAANGLIGAPAASDRVVALVLAINEAFVRSGYINTGVRFGAQAWPTVSGVLDLWLVQGRVVPSRPGGPAVEVAWSRRRPALAAVQDLGREPGSGGLTASYVRDRMASATQAPLNTVEVERDFRLLSDDAAIRTVNAQLTPGERAGEAHLLLTVEPQPRIDLYAMVATSRSPSIGGLRYSGGAAIRNLAFPGDLLSLDGGETDGLADGSVRYSTAVFDPSTIFDAHAAMDQAAVLAQAVRALGVRSKEASLDIGLSRRLIQTPLTPRPGGAGWEDAQSLTVGLRFGTDHAYSSLLGSPFSFTPGAVGGVTDFNVVRATADYVRRGERQVLAASAVATLGLTGTGSDIPGVIRPDPHFKVILVQMNYARRLAGALEFKARLDAQQSSGPIYSSEQFSAGGADTVRGYRENLLLADSGVRGSLELDCPVAFGQPACAARTLDWKSVSLSLFSDAAYLRNHQGVQPKPSGIASLGFGLAWRPTPAVLTEITYGALRAHAPQPGPLDIQDRGVQFSVTVHPLGLFEPS